MTNPLELKNLLKGKEAKEAKKSKEQFEKISKEIHDILIDNRCNALEAELIFMQMVKTYAITAKKEYKIYDRGQRSTTEASSVN